MAILEKEWTSIIYNKKNPEKSSNLHKEILKILFQKIGKNVKDDWLWFVQVIMIEL